MLDKVNRSELKQKLSLLNQQLSNTQPELNRTFHDISPVLQAKDETIQLLVGQLNEKDDQIRRLNDVLEKNQAFHYQDKQELKSLREEKQQLLLMQEQIKEEKSKGRGMFGWLFKS